MDDITLNKYVVKYTILQDSAYRKNIPNDQGFDVSGEDSDLISLGFTEAFEEDNIGIYEVTVTVY